MARRTYSPREAAIIAGMTQASVQKAITSKLVPIGPNQSRGSRRINEDAVLALALSRVLPKGVMMSARQVHTRLLAQGIGNVEILHQDPPTWLTLEGSVRINLSSALSSVVRRIRLILKGRELIEQEDASSSPRIKGTRIAIETLRNAANAGQTVDEIQTSHPTLDRDNVEAALLWAQAHPRRGRPARKSSSTIAQRPALVPDVAIWHRTMQITARQIDSWASGIQARADLARLARRLIQTNSSVVGVGAPAGDSISQPGWDVALECAEPDAWVPQGRSFWELSCDARPSQKATRDLNKRTKQTPRATRMSSTLVMLSGRRWIRKDRWLDKVRRQRAWKEVRAFDASDLEQWLEQRAGVALAFADELGLMGRGVESVSKAWSDWAEQCDPPISAEALFSDRNKVREELNRKIDDRLVEAQPTPIAVRGDSIDEAKAFVCAAVLERDLSRSALVVTEADGWRYVDQNPLLKIAVAANPTVAEHPIRRQGLVVLVPYASGDAWGSYRGSAGRDVPDISLSQPRLHEFEKALESMGVDLGQAGRLAKATGRSWSVFRRHRASNHAIRHPRWLHSEHTHALSTVCLLGAWREGLEADENLVSQLADRPYETIARDLRELRSHDDSPIVSIGEVWKAKSPLELLDLFGPKLTREELDRFFAIAKNVLEQDDPELELPDDQRYAARLYGKVRPQSPLLIQSLCDTLTKLAVRGPYVENLRNQQIDERVDSLVSNLLHECDATRWLSLSSLLPDLAEAGPEAFIRAVDVSLTMQEAPVTRLLTETASGFAGRCWHSGLLWAFERLAWAPKRLTKVCLLLARLCATPVKGNWGNTPANTLLDIFRTWMPQTAANLEQRLATLDKLISEEPDVAFDLLDRLLHLGPDSATPSMRPRWRDEDVGAGHGASDEERQTLSAVADRLIACAATAPIRLGKVVEKIQKIQMLDPPRVKRVIALLKALSQSEASDNDREAVRCSLRMVIHWQRNYSDAPLGCLARLEDIYKNLAPSDLIVRHRWLFAGSWPHLPMRVRDQLHAGREDELERWREYAVREVHDALSLRGVETLATSCARPRCIGATLARLKLDPKDLVPWIARRGADLSGSLGELFVGLLSAGGQTSTNILESTLGHTETATWTDDQRARLLTLAPCERAIWEIAASYGSNVEKAYWRSCDPWPISDEGSHDFALVIRHLLQARRPRAALNLYHFNRPVLDTNLLAEALEAIMRGEEHGEAELEPWQLGRAIDALEASDAIEEMRLVRIEFALFRALGLEATEHTRSLYRKLMSAPDVFVEILRLRFPSGSTAEGASESVKAAAQLAWSVLHDCHQQPCDKDGNVSQKTYTDFVDAVRERTRALELLKIGDITLGQILAWASPGADGIWPSEDVRPLLDRIDFQDVREGFRVGAMNKRGMTMRSYDEGGGQERNLAREYRGYACALQTSHPSLSATLEELARSYEHAGDREDVHAALRVEGF